MKRRILGALAASALLATTLVACSSGGGGGSSDAGSAKDTKTVTGTLRVLTPSYPANNIGKAAFQKVVDKFHETYPKMKVEPDYATYVNLNEKISTSIAGGDGYDVIASGVGWIAPFADKGVYADLSEFGVTPKTISKKMVPALVPPSITGLSARCAELSASQLSSSLKRMETLKPCFLKKTEFSFGTRPPFAAMNPA